MESGIYWTRNRRWNKENKDVANEKVRNQDVQLIYDSLGAA